MIKEFKGKVTVITGGASGIGRGLAHAFAKRGMNIVLADIDEEALEKVSQELSEIGAEVMTVATDVSDHTQVAHLADASYERFGRVNILCNNAGVGSSGPIRLLTLENWNWVLGVNLFGVIYGIKYFLNRMLMSKERCHIVNTSSLAGLLTGDNQPYSASKFAVVSISESLALGCFNTNVGVSVLCPGVVNTRITSSERNRPKEFLGSDYIPPFDRIIKNHPELEQLAKAAPKIWEAGTHPDQSGDIVFEAIKKDIFFIFTEAGAAWETGMKTRFDGIWNDYNKIKSMLKDLENQ